MQNTYLPVLDHCIICEKSSELLKSHVFPAFFRRLLIAESGLPSRFTNSRGLLKKKSQDLSKYRLCCRGCEQLLSKDEGTFSKALSSWLRNEGDWPSYGPWFPRFIAGLALKAGALHCYTASDGKIDNSAANFSSLSEQVIPSEGIAKLQAAMAAWRKFLLEQSSSPGRYEFHLFSGPATLTEELVGSFGHFPFIQKNGFFGLFILLNGLLVLAVIEAPKRLSRPSRIAMKGGRFGDANKEFPPEVRAALTWFSRTVRGQ